MAHRGDIVQYMTTPCRYYGIMSLPGIWGVIQYHYNIVCSGYQKISAYQNLYCIILVYEVHHMNNIMVLCSKCVSREYCINSQVSCLVMFSVMKATDKCFTMKF